jgi:iron-sulfur cluster assembly accessory protein
MLAMTLTPEAVAVAKTKLQNSQHARLRIGIRGGACEGFTLALSFADDLRSNDTEFLFDDLKIVVDAKSLALLMGAVIDYEKSLMQEGFILKSEKIQSVCSCGKSFVITKE